MAVISSVVMIFYLIFFYIIVNINGIACFGGTEKPNERGKYDEFKWNENFKSIDFNKDNLKIYCYNGSIKSVIYMWKTVQFEFERPPMKFQLFSGENESAVYDKYKDQSYWSPSSWFSWRRSDSVLELPAFSYHCVGVFTREHYVLHLKVRTINYWRVLQTVIGIMLFMCAPTLSRNSFFHYTSGVSLGVLASILILLYVVSRFIPKKTLSYSVLFLGSSFILYVLKVFWGDVNELISKYMDIVLAYCLLSGFISFVVCYRLGPVKNIRTFNLIQWSMQAIGLLLLFFSSEYRELSTAAIIVLLSAYFIPRRWIVKVKFIWFKFFPPKVKLLTEMEYIEQGHKETKNALQELRNYCSSPDCNTWKVVSRLKDPGRFANFVEAGRHFTDQELLEYNSEEMRDEFSEDDSYESDDEPNTSDSFRFRNNCR